jgi:hypothetical protein
MNKHDALGFRGPSVLGGLESCFLGQISARGYVSSGGNQVESEIRASK